MVSFTDTGKTKGKTPMRETVSSVLNLVGVRCCSAIWLGLDSGAISTWVAGLSSLPPCILCPLLPLLLTPSLLFQFRCLDALLTHLGSIVGMQGTCHPSIPLLLTSTLFNLTVMGKITDPQRCPNLCVTLHNKRDFAMWLQLRTLRMGDYSGSSRWVQPNHMSP